MLRPDEEDQLSGTPLPWWLRVPGGSFNISFPTFVVSVDNIRYLNELHRNRKSPAAQILDLLTELMFWLKASQHLEFYDLQKSWTSCPWQASRCWCWGCRRRRTGFNLTSWLCAITKLKRQTLARWQGPAQLQDFAHKQEKQQMSHSNSIYSDKHHVCNVLMVNLCSYKT